MELEKQLNHSREFLKSSIIDGWVPYSLTKRRSPSIEATSWAAIALAESDPQVVKKVVAFILNNQNNDGGWSTAPGVGQSDWTSALAVLALRHAKHSGVEVDDQKSMDKALKNGFHSLIISRMDLILPIFRLLLLLGAKRKRGLQFGRGWPWTKGSYSWVEPTAYSLMALKFPEVINDDKLTQIALSHADTFLLDHTCKGGGWNHGAYYSLGEYCPPYILTTAEALVAVINIREDEKVKEAVDYLKKVYLQSLSAWSLAWSIIALDAYDHDCRDGVKLLLGLQNKDGSFGSNFLITALSILALNTVNGTNIFKAQKPKAAR